MSPLRHLAGITVGGARGKHGPYVHLNGEPLPVHQIARDGIHVEPPDYPGAPSRVTITFLADEVLIVNSPEDAAAEAAQIVTRAFKETA